MPGNNEPKALDADAAAAACAASAFDVALARASILRACVRLSTLLAPAEPADATVEELPLPGTNPSPARRDMLSEPAHGGQKPPPALPVGACTRGAMPPRHPLLTPQIAPLVVRLGRLGH